MVPVVWSLLFMVVFSKRFSLDDYRIAVKDARYFPSPTEDDWQEFKVNLQDYMLRKAEQCVELRLDNVEFWLPYVPGHLKAMANHMLHIIVMHVEHSLVPKPLHISDQLYRFVTHGDGVWKPSLLPSRTRIQECWNKDSILQLFNETNVFFHSLLRSEVSPLLRLIDSASVCNTILLPDEQYWSAIGGSIEQEVNRSDLIIAEMCRDMSKPVHSDQQETMLHLITAKVERLPSFSFSSNARSYFHSRLSPAEMMKLENRESVSRFVSMIQRYQSMFDPYLRQATVLSWNLICDEFDLSRKLYAAIFQEINDEFAKSAKQFVRKCDARFTQDAASTFHTALVSYTKRFVQEMRGFYDNVKTRRNLGMYPIIEALGKSHCNFVKEGCFYTDRAIESTWAKTVYRCGFMCGRTSGCTAWTFFSEERKCMLHIGTPTIRLRYFLGTVSHDSKSIEYSVDRLERCESYSCGVPGK